MAEERNFLPEMNELPGIGYYFQDRAGDLEILCIMNGLSLFQQTKPSGLYLNMCFNNHLAILGRR